MMYTTQPPRRRLTPRLSGLFGSLLLLSLLCFVGCGSLNQPCETHEDCGWGYFCRSDKRCQQGCRYSVECPVGQLCRVNQCVTIQKDEDEDGFSKPLDCDDTDRLINPGVKEVCANKKDDNCDGVIDEEGCVNISCRPSEVRECYDGNEKTLSFPGTRCRKGKQICNSNGSWGDCQGQILPSAEQCDNLDSDCDGATDEDDKGQPLTQACYTGDQEKRGKGSCKEGIQTCKEGKWGECTGQVEPKTEICNEEDDDCDGFIDNVDGLNDACDTQKPGACKPGTQICDLAQKKLICQPTQPASDEVCGDNIDNDCDGFVDNTCPYVSRRVATLSGFPHHIAVSADFVLVSLRDTKKLLLFQNTDGPPPPPSEIPIAEEPHGLLFIQKTAYITTANTLFQLDPKTKKLAAVTRFAQAAHSAHLSQLSGRLLTRFAGVDAQNNPTFGLCQTEPATPKVTCGTLPTGITRLGSGISAFGIYGLLVSNLGLHFIDTFSLQEETTKRTQLPSGDFEYVTYDNVSQKIILVNPTSQEIHLYNTLTQRLQTPAITLQDAQGQKRKPGHILAAGGYAYIGQRDGTAISVLELQSQKVIRQVNVGLGPLGIASGPYDLKKGRTIWLVCPGDNSLWQFQAP